MTDEQDVKASIADRLLLASGFALVMTYIFGLAGVYESSSLTRVYAFWGFFVLGWMYTSHFIIQYIHGDDGRKILKRFREG